MSLPARCRAALAAAVLAWAACATTARADGVADLRAAIAAYDAGDLHHAAPLLRAATRTARTPKERARAWLYLGLTLASLEGVDAARAAFRASLLEDPEQHVDPERVPPTLVAELARVRKSVLGELRIECPEPNARVFVDGRSAGQTPLTLRLPVGRHDLRVLSADGRRAHALPNTLVTARTPTVVTARLTPRLGTLLLRVAPPDARLFKGPKLLATTPRAPVLLPAGFHRLTLRADGHDDATREVLVEPEGTTELRASLRRRATPWYRTRRAWGWSALGLGAGTTLAAVLVGYSATTASDALTAGLRDRTLTARQHADLSASVDRRSLTANILYGVGAASAVTGLVLLFVGERTTEPPTRRAWRLVPTGKGASLIAHY